MSKYDVRLVPLPSRKICANEAVADCRSDRMPLPGHSVPVVASTRRNPTPYCTSCAAPNFEKNEFRSAFTVICGRMFVLCTVDPYEVAATRSRPDDSPMPPIGVRRNPVLKYAYFADRNMFGLTT